MVERDKTRKPILFNPDSPRGFKLSRYRLERFIKCPRCFWLELRQGIKPAEPYPYSLNSAVDVLLKKEFDIYRQKKEPHPLMTQFGIDGVPYAHPQLNVWRESFKGFQHWHEPTGMIITGALDDVWFVTRCNAEVLAVVDYKSGSAKEEHPISDPYWDGYKRQVEVYQWLLQFEDTGLLVSRWAFFVGANGRKDEERFDARLKFDLKIYTHTRTTDWVGQTITKAYECLMGDIPASNADCENCHYRREAAKVELQK